MSAGKSEGDEGPFGSDTDTAALEAASHLAIHQLPGREIGGGWLPRNSLPHLEVSGYVHLDPVNS